MKLTLYRLEGPGQEGHRLPELPQSARDETAAFPPQQPATTSAATATSRRSRRWPARTISRRRTTRTPAARPLPKPANAASATRCTMPTARRCGWPPPGIPRAPDAPCGECHRDGAIAGKHPVAKLNHPTGDKIVPTTEPADLPLFSIAGHRTDEGVDGLRHLPRPAHRQEAVQEPCSAARMRPRCACSAIRARARWPAACTMRRAAQSPGRTMRRNRTSASRATSRTAMTR